MNVIDAKVRRPRGRPQTRTDAETHQIIAQAARREFMANGFAATSMDAVAKGAGVSTKTLYRLIPNKAELFKASIMDRIGRFLLAVDPQALDAFDVEAGIERLLIEYGLLTLGPETIAIQKLVIAESDRFPELAHNFYAEAVLPTRSVIENYLKRQHARGTIFVDDAHAATDMLRGMMIMEPQRDAMMGKRAAPGEQEVADRAHACARMFVQGCRRR